jgi:hypothetical protein
MIISLIILVIFILLSLVALSVFVKIKYCGPIYEYFKSKRDNNIEIGKKFYGISQKLVFGTIFIFSLMIVFIQLTVSVPNEARGAFYGVTGDEFSRLSYLNKQGNFSEFVNKYKEMKFEGIKSVSDYEEMLSANIQSVEEFYQYKKEEAIKREKALKEEAAKREKAKKDEEIRTANEQAEAKIAQQAAKAGVTIEEFKVKLEQQRESAKIISECKVNYAACTDNEMLINNYSGVSGAKASCVVEGKKLAKWDVDWPWASFGTFFVGDNYPKTGVITIEDPNVKFQNGFGAWQKRTVRCEYDLKSKSVIYVDAL